MPCRRERLGGEGGRSGQDGCGEGRGATRGGRRGGGCPPRSARATWVRARGSRRGRARGGTGRAAIDRSRDRRDGRGDRRSRSAHRGGGAVLLHADLARGVRPDGGQTRGLGAEAGEAADLRGGGGAMRRRRRRQRTGNLSRGKRVTRTTWPDDGSIADAERSGGKARGADLGHAGGAAGEGGGLAGRDGGGGGERGDGGHAWTRARGGSEAMRHVSGERREDRAQRRNSLSRRTEPRKQSVRAITPITSAILAPRYQHPRTFHPVP